MFDIDGQKELLNNCLSRFQTEWHIYQNMYAYYCGSTINNRIKYTENGAYDDAIFDDYLDNEGIGNFNFTTDKNDNKVSTNYIKRFIKEEVAMSVGVAINYISHAGDKKIVEAIRYNMEHWPVDEDIELAKNMILYSTTYTLFYIDGDAQFCEKVISPRHGFAYCDDFGNIIFFLHIFRKQFENKMLIDIYTEDEIIHCTEMFELISRQPHYFGSVPVSIACISDEGFMDTIYSDIRKLQDAYERNLSDSSSELTQFRNAYLALTDCAIKDEDLIKMKANGILQLPTNGTAAFLTKNINNAFVKDTLETIKNDMYALSTHIDPTEKLPSNTSSLAIGARLLNLRQKCKLNENGLANCIKIRIKFLLNYVNNLKGTNFDYKDVKVKFTPCIPADDMMMATIIGQLPGKISTVTALSQLSFIENPDEEYKKVEAEDKANSLGADLLNGVTPTKDTPIVDPITKVDSTLPIKVKMDKMV